MYILFIIFVVLIMIRLHLRPISRVRNHTIKFALAIGAPVWYSMLQGRHLFLVLDYRYVGCWSYYWVATTNVVVLVDEFQEISMFSERSQLTLLLHTSYQGGCIESSVESSQVGFGREGTDQIVIIPTVCWWSSYSASYEKCSYMIEHAVHWMFFYACPFNVMEELWFYAVVFKIKFFYLVVFSRLISILVMSWTIGWPWHTYICWAGSGMIILLSLYVISTISLDFVSMRTLSWEETGSSQFFCIYPDAHAHDVV